MTAEEQEQRREEQKKEQARRKQEKKEKEEANKSEAKKDGKGLSNSNKAGFFELAATNLFDGLLSQDSEKIARGITAAALYLNLKAAQLSIELTLAIIKFFIKNSKKFKSLPKKDLKKIDKNLSNPKLIKDSTELANELLKKSNDLKKKLSDAADENQIDNKEIADLKSKLAKLEGDIRETSSQVFSNNPPSYGQATASIERSLEDLQESLDKESKNLSSSMLHPQKATVGNGKSLEDLQKSLDKESKSLSSSMLHPQKAEESLDERSSTKKSKGEVTVLPKESTIKDHVGVKSLKRKYDTIEEMKDELDRGNKRIRLLVKELNDESVFTQSKSKDKKVNAPSI